MLNNMEELDITKAYYLGDLDKKQLSLFSNMLPLNHTSTSRKDILKWLLYYRKNLLLFYNEEENFWYFSTELDLEIVNALTLFEPQFKQGDKVLYTDDLEFWHEGVFLTKYNDSYIIDSDEMLLYAIDIKPYEDDIKVGDWVHNSDGHVLKCKYLGLNNNPNWIKITNQDLIDKLNKL